MAVVAGEHESGDLVLAARAQRPDVDIYLRLGEEKLHHLIRGHMCQNAKYSITAFPHHPYHGRQNHKNIEAKNRSFPVVKFRQRVLLNQWQGSLKGLKRPLKIPKTFASSLH